MINVLKLLFTNIANLIKVKTIVTLMFTVAVLYCSVMQINLNEMIWTLYGSVLTFYFTKTKEN